VVAAGAREFDLVTAHLITPRFGLSATRQNPLRGLGEWRENVADRMTQAGRLAEDLRGRSRPAIVAGDFNAPDASLVVRTLLDTGLRDAFSVAGVGYGHTWGHSLRFGFSFLRIDHILVDREFAIAACFVGGTGSAHRPVIADLYLSRAQAQGVMR
jgi:endonuclease/exonuclease/phosphatase (EEP) superfamily protein YafD